MNNWPRCRQGMNPAKTNVSICRNYCDVSTLFSKGHTVLSLRLLSADILLATYRSNVAHSRPAVGTSLPVIAPYLVTRRFVCARHTRLSLFQIAIFTTRCRTRRTRFPRASCLSCPLFQLRAQAARGNGTTVRDAARLRRYRYVSNCCARVRRRRDDSKFRFAALLLQGGGSVQGYRQGQQRVIRHLAGNRCISRERLITTVPRCPT